RGYVRARPRLRRERDEVVRRAAGPRVRDRGVRVYGDAPPARGGRRLLRPRHPGSVAGLVHARAEGIDGGSPVRGMITRVREEILSEQAREFVALLHRELNPTRLDLLERRKERQRALDGGELPRCLAETQAVREREVRL